MISYLLEVWSIKPKKSGYSVNQCDNTTIVVVVALLLFFIIRLFGIDFELFLIWFWNSYCEVKLNDQWNDCSENERAKSGDSM